MKNAIVQIYVSLDGYTFPDWIPQSDEISTISILSGPMPLLITVKRFLPT